MQRFQWRRWTHLLRLVVVSLAYGAFAAEPPSSAPSTPTEYPIPNGSFEAPALPASPGYQYAPAGSGWTLASGAGLSRNGTAFTAGNPGAPDGAQVLFLQGGAATATQTLTNVTAGFHVFTFSAAQRGAPFSTQTFQLRVNGVAIQSFTPSGAAYQGMSSVAVMLSSGTNTIQLRGLNPLGGDHTAFVDNVRATRVQAVSISGFESPAIPISPGYVYAPSGGPWTFGSLSGLTRNNTGFTAGNPGAPEGNQVLFLQGGSTASTSVTIPSDGFYRFRFKAALRGNNPTQPAAKRVRISVGANEVGEFPLDSTSYVEKVSTAIHLGAGAATLSLTGVDPSPGDHTGFVDDLRLERLHDWHDPQVWSGPVPGANDRAMVPAGSVVCIHGTVTPRAIDVRGELLVAQNSNLTLTTKWIMVMNSGSRLEIGQAFTPYTGSAVITLNATASDHDETGMGTKVVGVMNNGIVSLHGQERVSWTQLGASVSAGSFTIVLKEPVDWKAGDSIVVVSSRRDWNEAEKLNITSVGAGGTTLTLSAPLKNPHSGVVKSYTDGTRTWAADLRAQVGLLTHNIKIQGDAASASTSFGGHVMIMTGSRAYVSGVELYNMGQQGRLGRYPFHWHMLGNVGTGQYFKNSSIHQSYNRAITIHGTESTLVENNFFYDHFGHGVFLEDGSERFNVIRRNVTLLTRRPVPGYEITRAEKLPSEVQNRMPASYWITNPQNTFEDNVAAGTEGTGFWFAFPEVPMGESTGDPRFAGVQPNKLPLISFKGNSAHSTMSGFDIFDGLKPPVTPEDEELQKNLGWLENGLHLMENCTWYANFLAVYTGIGSGGPTDNLVFRNNVFVDNTGDLMLASNSIVERSVFVASSGEGLLKADEPRYFYVVYDGPGQVRDSHFVGWDAAGANFLFNVGAAGKHPNHLFTANTTSNGSPPRISLDDYANPPATMVGPNHPGNPRVWSLVLRDVTGSIGGKANTSIVSNHPFLLVGDEYQPPGWVRAYRSDHRFVLSRLTYGLGGTDPGPSIVCKREKAGTPTVSINYNDSTYEHKEWHQLPFIAGEGFEYTYTYQALPTASVVTMNMENATPGDSYVAHFKRSVGSFGQLPGLSFESSQGSFAAHPSLDSLRASAMSGYYVDPGGDLHIKAVATGRDQWFKIDWN